MDEVTPNDSKELILREKDDIDNIPQIMKDVVPLAIEAGNIIDFDDRREEDLDTEYLLDNIADAVEQEIYPQSRLSH